MRHAIIAAGLALLAAPASAQVTDCDRLAGYRLLPRIEGAPGVYAVTEAEAAVAACTASHAADPADPWFALLLARARLAADPEDRGIVDLLGQAVEGLPALAASELGRLYEQGSGALPTGDRQARDFYQTACDHWPDRTAAPGCTRLAVMKIEGRGGPTDEAAGFALLEELCQSGWGTACLQQALQTDLRGEGDFDTISRETAALFDAGCRGGDLLACSQFGYRLEQGDGVTHDPARAQALYRQSCEGGEPQGCSYLGEIYRSGYGVPPDMAEAVRLFRIGCSGNDPYACVTLGDILSQGRGVPVDVPGALVVLDHACWLGDPEACDTADSLR